MAIEQLLAALETNGAAQVEQVAAAARAEADAITAQARDQADRRRRAALETHERALRSTAALALAGTRLAARRTVITARTRLLERVFARAGAALDAVAASPAYRQQLPAAIAAALDCFGDEPVEIRCPPALGKAVRAGVASLPKKRASISVVTDRAVGPGFVVRSADGVVAVDDTLAARLERQHAALSLAALHALESPS